MAEMKQDSSLILPKLSAKNNMLYFPLFNEKQTTAKVKEFGINEIGIDIAIPPPHTKSYHYIGELKCAKLRELLMRSVLRFDSNDYSYIDARPVTDMQLSTGINNVFLY